MLGNAESGVLTGFLFSANQMGDIDAFESVVICLNACAVWFERQISKKKGACEPLRIWMVRSLTWQSDILL